MNRNKYGIVGAVITLLALVSPAGGQAENTDFDLNTLKQAIVVVQTEGSVSESGVIISPEGHILILNSEEKPVEVGSEVWITYPNLSHVVKASVSHVTTEIGASGYRFALVEIDNSDIGLIRSHLIEGTLSHYNPLIAYGTAELNDVVHALSHAITSSDVAIPLLTTGTIYAVSDQPGVPTVYNAKVTAQSSNQALGGMLVDEAGWLIGFIVSYNEAARIAFSFSANELCAGDIAFCQVMMELYRESPSNRQSRPSSRLNQLTDSKGLSNGARLSNGEVQLEYFCHGLGLQLRPNTDDLVWECFNPDAPEQTFALLPQHHDLICQQSYRTPSAIAFQVDIAGISPLYSWRCYG